MRLVAGEYLYRLLELGAVITWVQDSGAQKTHAQELEGASWPSQQQRYKARFIEERNAVAARQGLTDPITVRLQSGADSVEAESVPIAAVAVAALHSGLLASLTSLQLRFGVPSTTLVASQ
jgi:hypothetical protein